MKPAKTMSQRDRDLDDQRKKETMDPHLDNQETGKPDTYGTNKTKHPGSLDLG